MFRSRIIIQNWGTTQDESGGLVKTLTSSWSKFAKVENRSGGIATDRQQRDWEYDYKITVRFEPSRVEKEGYLIVYGSVTMQIKSISFQDEGKRHWVILRCTVVE